MLLRGIPLLSALILWLASSSQAALFVASPPASSAPSTPENAYPAFLPNESESRIGLLVSNDPLDRTDPMGLEPPYSPPGTIDVLPDVLGAGVQSARKALTLSASAGQDSHGRALEVRINGYRNQDGKLVTTAPTVGHETRGGQQTEGEKIPAGSKPAFTAHDHPVGGNLGFNTRDKNQANGRTGGDDNSGQVRQPSFIAYGQDNGANVGIYVPSSNPALAAHNQGGVILYSTDGKTMTDGKVVYPQVPNPVPLKNGQ